MNTIILRTIPSILVLLGGVASVIYGARYHTQPVSEEREIEIPIAPPPMPMPPDGMPFEGDPMGPQGFGPPPMMGPPPFANKIKEKVIITNEEPESKLIRDVTIGGVTLVQPALDDDEDVGSLGLFRDIRRFLAAGHIRRTYIGQPPSLCPT